MTPITLIGLKDGIDGRCVVDFIAIGASAIIPGIRITPSRRYRSTGPESHSE